MSSSSLSFSSLFSGSWGVCDYCLQQAISIVRQVLGSFFLGCDVLPFYSDSDILMSPSICDWLNDAWCCHCCMVHDSFGGQVVSQDFVLAVGMIELYVVFSAFFSYPCFCFLCLWWSWLIEYVELEDLGACLENVLNSSIAAVASFPSVVILRSFSLPLRRQC